MRRRATLLGPSAAAVLLSLHHLTAASSFSLDGPPRIAATWRAVDHSSEIPRIDPPRSGHVAFFADGGDDSGSSGVPYVFGGYCEEVNKGGKDGGVTRNVDNDMWRWIGRGAGGWEKLDQNGEVPGPRLASASAVLNGRPYLFGGWDPQTPGTGGVILDTVHCLDLSTRTWSKLSATVPDGPTSRHVALSLPGDTEALIHNHRCEDHVLVFDSKTEQFRKQQTTGEGPSPRGLHCAVMCGKNAVVFGGAAQSGAMSDEAFVLDTDSWTWTKLRFGAEVGPSPRASPCACSVSPNCVLIFGGAETTESGLNGRADLWALHFDPGKGTGRWELLIDDSGENDDVVVPPPRNAASLTEIEIAGDAKEGSHTFLLQGGWAPFRTTWGDNYILDVRVE